MALQCRLPRRGRSIGDEDDRPSEDRRGSCGPLLTRTLRFALYTIRKIPPALDALIRRRARSSGKSLNAVAVEALAQGLGFRQAPEVRRDLRDVVGTWRKDAAVEAAFAAQDRVDKALWK